MKPVLWSAAGLLTLSGLFVGLARYAEKQGPDAAPLEVVRIGEMSVERATHQATRLPTGEVLITGGCAGRCDRILSSVELYDPTTVSFRSLSELAVPRAGGAAIGLPAGRVLVTGGWTGRQVAATAEIYDPAKRRWAAAGEMLEGRISHSIAPLPDGQVLVVGGETQGRRSLASAEIFDPATGNFSAVGSMRTPRAYTVATALADGRVLVTGGHRAPGEVVGSAEIFDPATGDFHPAGEMLTPRTKHAAVLLDDGRVLVIGGSQERDDRGRLASTELYDPETGGFSPGPEMRSPRHKIPDAALVLPSGGVLVGGGAAGPEVWHPAESEFLPIRGRLEGLHEFATATLLPTGEVLVLGGYHAQVRSSASAWLIRPSR